MEIKYKKLHKDAQSPKQGKEGDGCWDITCVGIEITDKYIEYDLGIAIKVPEDHIALIAPRSSVTNKDLILKNGVGIIDPNYRNSMKARFYVTTSLEYDLHADIYEIGDRVVQILILPRPFLEWVESDDLGETNRDGGFGTSGN